MGSVSEVPRFTEITDVWLVWFDYIILRHTSVCVEVVHGDTRMILTVFCHLFKTLLNFFCTLLSGNKTKSSREKGEAAAERWSTPAEKESSIKKEEGE